MLTLVFYFKTGSKSICSNNQDKWKTSLNLNVVLTRLASQECKGKKRKNEKKDPKHAGRNLAMFLFSKSSYLPPPHIENQLNYY